MPSNKNTETTKKGKIDKKTSTKKSKDVDKKKTKEVDSDENVDTLIPKTELETSKDDNYEDVENVDVLIPKTKSEASKDEDGNYQDSEDIGEEMVKTVIKLICQADISNMLTSIEPLTSLATEILSTIPLENIEEEIEKMKKSGILNKKYSEYKNKVDSVKPRILPNNYLSCLDRILSFDGSTVKNDVIKLAEAGFYSIGENKTACFFCKLEISDWREDNDPLEWHYKTNPLCDFARSIYVPKELKETSSKILTSEDVKRKIKNMNKHLSNFFRELADSIDVEHDYEHDYAPIHEDNSSFYEDYDERMPGYPPYQPYSSRHPPLFFEHSRTAPSFPMFASEDTFGEKNNTSKKNNKQCTSKTCKKSKEHKYK
jgi:hypothetical protein